MERIYQVFTVLFLRLPDTILEGSKAILRICHRTKQIAVVHFQDEVYFEFIRVADKQEAPSPPSWQLVPTCLRNLRVEKLQVACSRTEPTLRKGGSLEAFVTN